MSCCPFKFWASQGKQGSMNASPLQSNNAWTARSKLWDVKVKTNKFMLHQFLAFKRMKPLSSIKTFQQSVSENGIIICLEIDNVHG